MPGLYALQQGGRWCLPASFETEMFTSYLLAKIRNYLKYRETMRELANLSDRELEDIGVSRYQIESVARSGIAA